MIKAAAPEVSSNLGKCRRVCYASGSTAEAVFPPDEDVSEVSAAPECARRCPVCNEKVSIYSRHLRRRHSDVADQYINASYARDGAGRRQKAKAKAKAKAEAKATALQHDFVDVW